MLIISVNLTAKSRYLAVFAILVAAFLIVGTLLFSSPSYASLTEEQRTYLQAIEQIKAGQRTALNRNKQRLKNHPLYPYVLFQDYIRNLDRVSEAQLNEFFQTYPHLVATERLQQRWLGHLVSKAQWDDFIHQSTLTQSTPSACHAITAQIKTQQPINLDHLKDFWLKQSSADNQCREIEQFLFSLNQVPTWMVWQKIDQAMLNQDTDQARHLMPKLPPQDQKILRSWLDYHRNPEKLNDQLPSLNSDLFNQKILIHTLKRLAHRDPQSAAKLLDTHKKAYQIGELDELEIRRNIGLRLAYRYDEQAQPHLNQVNQTSGTEDSLRWQAQIALRQSNWPELLHVIGLMNRETRTTPRWTYWTARALEELQQAQQAHLLYESIAEQRNYYGFLAADKLDRPYAFRAQQTPTLLTREQLYQRYPALELIEQLFAVNWSVSANREWLHLTRTAEPDHLPLLAQIAIDWQRHNIAISTLARGQHWDLLELRFPTPYKEPVMQNAQKNDIDPAWIYSVMRRESAFSPDIRSSAGAIGLMQILPNTARYVGRQIGFSSQQYRNLTDAQSNIELGSAYLKYLLERYNGNLVMATAAYNAGPRRVDQWAAETHLLPADQWIDTIPFRETRRYVKAVLEYTMVFQNLLDQRYDRLTPLMSPIQNPNQD